MLRAEWPQQPRSIHCTLLLSLLHRTALPAAYVELGVLREGRDCCEGSDDLVRALAAREAAACRHSA